MAVVVGDHGQVAVAFAVGHLIHADLVEAVQTGVVDVGGDHPDHDRGDGLPGAAQQPGDGGLVGALGQVGHDILEVAGEPRARPGPRHRFGPHSLAAPTGQPADLGLQVQSGGAQVQVPPAARRPVVDRGGRPAARAGQPLRRRARRSDTTIPVVVKVTPTTLAPGMASILLNAVVARTRRSKGFGWLGSSEPYEGRRVRVLQLPPRQPRTLTDQANDTRELTTRPTQARGVPES